LEPESPHRILIVDDDPDDRALVGHELRREFRGIELVSVGGAAALESALAGDRCDVVVTDYHLHWTTGLIVLRRIQALWPDCPVVMFTGTGSEEVAVEAMRAGLADYVIKSPSHFARLPVAVHGAWTSARRTRRLHESELRYASLFENNRCAMLLVDPLAHLIFDANSAAATFYGYPRKELRGMPISDLAPDATGDSRFDLDALRTGALDAIFAHNRLASGDTRDVEVRGGQIEVAGHDLIYCIIHDVTERRRAEAERDRLYREVRDREAQIERLLGQMISAQERERQRICLEVHDGVVQSMASATHYIEALGCQPELSAKSRAHLVEAGQLLRAANREAREIISTLRPAALDMLGLVEALREYLATVAARTDIIVEYVAEPRRFSDAVETTLYRIAQEAVRNVEKHAQARHLSISVGVLDGRVVARIVDDGVGFDDSAGTSPGGVGMIGMRMRAELLGGSLKVASCPGCGTTLSVSLPIRPTAGEVGR